MHQTVTAQADAVVRVNLKDPCSTGQAAGRPLLNLSIEDRANLKASAGAAGRQPGRAAAPVKTCSRTARRRRRRGGGGRPGTLRAGGPSFRPEEEDGGVEEEVVVERRKRGEGGGGGGGEGSKGHLQSPVRLCKRVCTRMRIPTVSE